MSDEIQQVATASAPAALGAYSQAVEANGFVFVSGQLGIDPQTGELVEGDAGDQAAQALKNIKFILDSTGLGTDKVVKATIYLKDVNDVVAVNERHAEVFINPVKPARVAVGGIDIPKGALVEIDAIAAR